MAAVIGIVTGDFARGGGGGSGGGRPSNGSVHITASAIHQGEPHVYAETVAHHSEVGPTLAAFHNHIKKHGLPEHHVHIHHEEGSTTDPNKWSPSKMHFLKLNAKGYHSASYPPGHYGAEHPPPVTRDEAVNSGQWRL
jgi:hypothetical protein